MSADPILQLVADLTHRVTELERRLLDAERELVILRATRATDVHASAREIARTEAEHQEREKTAIIAALEKHEWNRLRAAQELGMPRRTFYRRLEEYGIK